MKNNNDMEKRFLDNWELYLNIVSRIEDADLKKSLLNFCNEQHERIIVCPASTKSNYVGAFSGGLVWHSLNVLKIMKEMNKINGSLCTAEEMIVTSLFHDIGKIGNSTEDYYFPQESGWHRERGFLFEINNKLLQTPIVARSIWWLNNYNVKLSENCVEALFSLHSSTVNNRISEIYNVSNLSLLLQQSVRSACVINKGKTSILD